MTPRTWLITHTHRFGGTHTIVTATTEPDADFLETWATAVLDFEPDREDEWLECEEVPVLTLTDLRDQLAMAQAGTSTSAAPKPRAYAGCVCPNCGTEEALQVYPDDTGGCACCHIVLEVVRATDGTILDFTLPELRQYQ